MIEEAYVSFEVARLLKEKGFDEPLVMTYWGDGTMSAWHIAEENSSSHGGYVHYTAPTQQMAMRWLREVHNIMITIYHSIESGTLQFVWRVDRFRRDSDRFIIQDLEGVGDYYTYGHDCDAYEEACEAAIRYCLENQIKND